MSEVSAKQSSKKLLGLERLGGEVSVASEQQEHAASQPAESCTPEDESTMFKSDSFRMNCMKVLPCSKRYVHDWTECPFAHPQEKARRRDPRDYNYTGIACPSMKKEGLCAFGDHCPYAHNVFEYWLHPTRYRTQLCNDGTNCRRKICFFAHSLEELRVPACKPFVSPEALASAAAAAAADVETRRKAGTVGTPIGGGGGGGGGKGLPQVDALTVQQYEAAAAQILQGSNGFKGSPSKAGDAAGMAAAATLSGPYSSGAEGGRGSPNEPLSGLLQQLHGRPFSQQEQQVIELVTSMLSQNKVTAAQAASILQAMLPANALQLLQSQLLAPGTPTANHADLALPRCNSDPLREMGGRPSFDEAALSTGRLSFQGGQQAAAMYNTMLALQTGVGQQAQQGVPPFPGASPRASMEYPRNVSLDTVSSMRSSFDAAGMRESMDFGPTRGNSLDYGRGSMDLRRGSVDMMGGGGGGTIPSPVALAQASALYQQQQQEQAQHAQQQPPVASAAVTQPPTTSPSPLPPLLPQLSPHPRSSIGGLPPLAPVPENAAMTSQPLSAVSAALAQLAARASMDPAGDSMMEGGLGGLGGVLPLPTSLPSLMSLSSPQMHQLQAQLQLQQQQQHVRAVRFDGGEARGEGGAGGGSNGGPFRRHSVESAAALHAAYQRQQAQQQAGRKSADAPYHMLAPLPEGAAYQHIPPVLMPHAQQYSPVGGVPHLSPPQYAQLSPPPMQPAVQPPLWGQPPQYGQQYEQGDNSSQGASSDLMRMSADFRRLSLEGAEQRGSIDRRSAPVVANPYASSFFSGGPGGAAGGSASPHPADL